MPIYGKKGPVFSMFHQKSRGVSLILFSDGVPEMESVEKPNYARHGHGASILDYTIYIVFVLYTTHKITLELL